MVHQEQVGMIVSLIQNIPGDCAEYFPTQEGQVIQYGEFSVQLVREDCSQQLVVRREFSVQVTSG